MISFTSASNGTIDTARAIDDAVGHATRDVSTSATCQLVVLHVTMGHDETDVVQNVRRHFPSARIAGCTCAGVIGREGANESMRAIAIMLVWGNDGDVDMTVAPRLDGSNSRVAATELAASLVAGRGKPEFVMFLGSGIDVACDEVIDGIESVLGPDTTIFGGTSADNMRGVGSYQFIDDDVHEHAAVLVGFFDPTLEVTTIASHGFLASGVEFTVTASTGNRVEELDGENAWRQFTKNLGLAPTCVPGDTIPTGAVGVMLAPDVAAEYGDSHVLRVITRRTSSGAFLMPVTCPVGTRLSLMRRDEERIFANLDVMMRTLVDALGSSTVIGVFHADCGARGRLTLDRVSKDEIVHAMQTPLFPDGAVGPWLGMYGFGEIARLGGRNQFHNYTTALYVVSRR